MDIVEYLCGPYDIADSEEFVSICIGVDEDGDENVLEITHDSFDAAYDFKKKLETLQFLENESIN